MQLRVDRAELLNELGPMQGVVERKTTIPVLSHILLTARDEKLQIAATDLDVSLTSWTRGDVEEEGGIAVQARKFLEIIRSLPEAEVQLVQEDPKILTIKAGHSRFKLHGLAPEDFPTLPEASSNQRLEVPYPLFRRMISKVLFAV